VRFYDFGFSQVLGGVDFFQFHVAFPTGAEFLSEFHPAEP